MIALSGLGGHAFGSFKQRRGGYMWLRDSVPNDLEGARVMIYGHDSHYIKAIAFKILRHWDVRSTTSYELFATEYVQSSPARSHRSPLCQLLVPKIIIGHSLGGLIIKQV